MTKHLTTISSSELYRRIVEAQLKTLDGLAGFDEWWENIALENRFEIINYLVEDISLIVEANNANIQFVSTAHNTVRQMEHKAVNRAAQGGKNHGLQ